MGNTVGAIVFLAAATYLGWTVVRGRAQSFLTAVATGGAGGGAGGPPSTPPTSPPITGPLAGTEFQFGDQLAPTPNVLGNVFGQNGSLNAPSNSGPYGPYSPLLTIGNPNL